MGVLTQRSAAAIWWPETRTTTAGPRMEEEEKEIKSYAHEDIKWIPYNVQVVK